jgi:Zn-dependent protease
MEPTEPRASLPTPQPGVRRAGEARLTSGGMSIGSIAGVKIDVDWSLWIVFVLVLFNLGAGVFPSWHPNWHPAAIWGTAFTAALLFFGSVLLHELAHALVARAQGVSVRRITLFLFGGLAELSAEPARPRAEFLTAIVGPLTSIVLGVAATLLATRLAGFPAGIEAADSVSYAQARELMADAGPLATLLLWLGPINLLLGVFNLVPGFPLDGGRVLRSVLWGATGDLLKATRWATNAGRVFGWVLIAFGIMNLFSGLLAQGLWLLLIGWFLNNAAHQSYQQLWTRHALHDVPVSRVMWADPARVSPELSLDELVRDHIMTSDQIAFPVEQDGEFVGLVALDDVREIPQNLWAGTRVGDVMTPARELGVLAPEAHADRALEDLARLDVDQLPVLHGSHLEGMVRRRDLLRWIALQEQSGPRRALP